MSLATITLAILEIQVGKGRWNDGQTVANLSLIFCREADEGGIVAQEVMTEHAADAVLDHGRGIVGSDSIAYSTGLAAVVLTIGIAANGQ